MTKEMMERLQSNEKPFDLMSREEQEALQSCFNEDSKCILIHSQGKHFITAPAPTWYSHTTYRLSSSYKQKESGHFVEYPIRLRNDIYECHVAHMQETCWRLHVLPGLVGFAGIKFEGQAEGCWAANPALFQNEQGLVFTATPSEDIRPAIPKTARFWVED